MKYAILDILNTGHLETYDRDEILRIPSDELVSPFAILTSVVAVNMASVSNNVKLLTTWLTWLTWPKIILETNL
ncbi:hypothetical protein ACN38_g10067 [Penicillium nordicum]|uniref:Uncharacterized protein n=1 Tax=Penicillium nordicum TaxID=229535 RepID=A0A0M9WC60_9EURO|nr:hypothetical protein ACN38_g10067 [Penicillium nordicum]